MEQNDNLMMQQEAQRQAACATQMPVYNQIPAPQQGDEDESINLSDFFTLCLRCWKWFVLSVCACVALAVLYILWAPKVYTRNAQVMVEDEDSKPQSITSTLSDLGLFATSTNVANELLAFQSPALVGDVIQRLNLRYTYTYKKFLRSMPLYGDSMVINVNFIDIKPNQGISMRMNLLDNGKVAISKFKLDRDKYEIEKPVTLGDTVPTPAGRMVITEGPNYNKDFEYTIRMYLAPMPTAIQNYQQKLSISLADDDSSVIDFSLKDTDKKRADAFLDTMIDIYNELYVERKAKMAVATSNFINERLNVIEKELGNVDSDIANYKGEHLMPDVQTASEMYMTNANENTKKQLDVQTQIDVTRFLIQYMNKAENKGKLLPGNLGIDNQGITSQIDDYNTQQLKRDQLLTTTGENSPLVKDVDASLASLRAALSTSLDNQVRILQTQLNALVRSDRLTNAKIASSPTQAKYLLSVERQQKVKEALYLFLLQKREENELSLAFTPYNTRVITPPYGQIKPTSPITRNVLLIAFVIGLLIPAIVLFLSETMNSRVRNRSDLDGIHVPFIGEIPEEQNSTNRMKRWKRKWRDTMGKSSRIEEAPTLVVKPRSNTVLNEAFRMVRSNLEFMTRNGKNKVAMVTSFNPGSGKSFVSVNLGAAMAIKKKDSRVIIIDLDLRRASTSKVVGNHAPGVSDYLSEATNDIKSLIRATDQEGLFIMPVGTIPPNPSELLYTPRLQQLIDKLREDYDFILLDCPPADVVADATIITPLADMTIFIVRAGLLDRRMLPDLDRFYDRHRFNNMTLLLNGTKSIAAPYRRYAYHSYYNKKD